MNSYGQIFRDGMWNSNVAFVQLLGLCPLLAVTNTVINGLGLGLATTLTLVSSNVVVSLVRDLIRPEIRIPVFVLVIASVVTAIELAMNAWFHDLYKILGIFIPLIVTNCAIIARAESFASKNNVLRSFADGLFMGLGFTIVLIMLGALREGLGFGTLFQQAHLMFGEVAQGVQITLIDDYQGYLLAILPPGAFFGLGLLIAGKNIVDKRAAQRKAVLATTQVSATSP